MKKTGFILIILLTAAIWSCRSRMPGSVPVQTSKDSIFIEKLVPVAQPADSAVIRALLECDENGKVVLQWLDMANSKNVALQFTIDSLGNVLAKMEVPPDTVYAKETTKSVGQKDEVPVYIEKELSGWERWKMEAGGWLTGALGVAVVAGAVWLWKRLMG